MPDKKESFAADHIAIANIAAILYAPVWFRGDETFPVAVEAAIDRAIAILNKSRERFNA